MNRLLMIFLLSAMTTLAAQAQQHKLWYNQPARHWLEALPVGNSHLGAMVYGKTDTEEIQLNEETFWSGSPHNNNSPEAKAHLQEVRDSIFAGKEEAAHAIIDKYFFKGPHGMRFLPLGSLKLAFGHTAITDFRRELNLSVRSSLLRPIMSSSSASRPTRSGHSPSESPSPANCSQRSSHLS